MHSDRRGTDKKQPGQDLPDKRQNPRTKPPRTIEREFVQGPFVRVFCTRPNKNRGGPRCVTYMYFKGVPGCVTKCDKGVGGSKLAKNSVTYFTWTALTCLATCTYITLFNSEFGSRL